MRHTVTYIILVISLFIAGCRYATAVTCFDADGTAYPRESHVECQPYDRAANAVAMSGKVTVGDSETGHSNSDVAATAIADSTAVDESGDEGFSDYKVAWNIGLQTDNKDGKSGKSPSHRIRLPLFITLKGSVGQVFRTNDFVNGKHAIPFYGAAALKFGVSSSGNHWQDEVYGMPYYGIGVYSADFGRRKDLGKPVSLILFQGAELAKISDRLSLNYEWNLGVALGWKAYDAFDNPYNVAIGSDVNVHVGAGIYLKWIASRSLDLHFGADVTHFSNGAYKMPNSGLNMYSVFVEASYNFNRQDTPGKAEHHEPPHYLKHYVSDISLTVSSKGISVDTTGRGKGLPSRYIDRKFKVLGLNYSLMTAPAYRYRYGLSLDMVYDDSAGVWAEMKRNFEGKDQVKIHSGKMSERFSIGFSAKGELVLPGYSIFANLGLQAYRGNKAESRFYQIIGIKAYLKENFYATFGIRANHFSSAQYLFWSFGYTISHYRNL